MFVVAYMCFIWVVCAVVVDVVCCCVVVLRLLSLWRLLYVRGCVLSLARYISLLAVVLVWFLLLLCVCFVLFLFCESCCRCCAVLLVCVFGLNSLCLIVCE